MHLRQMSNYDAKKDKFKYRIKKSEIMMGAVRQLSHRRHGLQKKEPVLRKMGRKMGVYLFWRSPILGNLLFNKTFKPKKYVGEIKRSKNKEWGSPRVEPVSFRASTVINNIPVHKRFFPASSVIPKAGETLGRN